MNNNINQKTCPFDNKGALSYCQKDNCKIWDKERKDCSITALLNIILYMPKFILLLTEINESLDLINSNIEILKKK